MAIVLRSSLESWMFQAGRFVWEQVHRERSGPSIPQLRAALVEHATAAARADTRSELTRELRGVFEAALALAAERGITRTELERPRSARDSQSLGTVARASVPERPRSARDSQSLGTVAPASVPERPRSARDSQSLGTVARASVLNARPERARARNVLDRVAALRETAFDVLDAPKRARKALSDLGSSVVRGIERRDLLERPPRRPRARHVLDRVAAEIGSTVADPMAVLDRVTELGSSVVSVADPGAVLDRVADLGASVADAADRGASAVIRGAAAAMGGGEMSPSCARDAVSGVVSQAHVPPPTNAYDQPTRRAQLDGAKTQATAAPALASSSVGSRIASVRPTSLREAVAIVAERLTTPPRTTETSLTRVRAAIGPWRVDAVMSRWLRLRREPRDVAAVSGGRGPARWVASQLSSLGHRGYDSHARFALRARWPVLRERRWFGRRQRQFKVNVEQRSKGAMLATIPASAGAQIAAWAVTTTSRFLLERWLLPYLMRKAAPLRVAPVAGKLLWGFGRVAVPTGLRLLARTPTRAR